jgi:hypothetical protein
MEERGEEVGSPTPLPVDPSYAQGILDDVALHTPQPPTSDEQKEIDRIRNTLGVQTTGREQVEDPWSKGSASSGDNDPQPSATRSGVSGESQQNAVAEQNAVEWILGKRAAKSSPTSESTGQQGKTTAGGSFIPGGQNETAHRNISDIPGFKDMFDDVWGRDAWDGIPSPDVPGGSPEQPQVSGAGEERNNPATVDPSPINSSGLPHTKEDDESTIATNIPNEIVSNQTAPTTNETSRGGFTEHRGGRAIQGTAEHSLTHTARKRPNGATRLVPQRRTRKPPS